MYAYVCVCKFVCMQVCRCGVYVCVLIVLLFHSRSYIDFDIFVSHKEKFCNGTETLTDSLMNGVYFQYTTNNRAWITVDTYNGNYIVNFARYIFFISSITRVATRSITENVLEFQSNDIRFRWIQYDTIGSPSWAIDDIIIMCPDENFFKSISFEENPE